MKIKYEFVDEIVEVEVSEEWVNVISELDRLERNNDKKEKRRHYSLDAYTYEGRNFAVEDENINSLFENKDEVEKLKAAIHKLSDKQQELIKAIYLDNYSITEYAEKKGVTKGAISQQLKIIYKK